jgi:DNA primase
MEFLTKIKRVLATHHLADHVEDFTNLTRVGSHLIGNCPICRTKQPDSLRVYPDLRFFHCTACENAGDVIEFVSKMFGMDLVATVNLLEKQIPDERIGPTRGTRHDLPLAERERRARAWGELEDKPEFTNRPKWRLEEWEL